MGVQRSGALRAVFFASAVVCGLFVAFAGIRPVPPASAASPSRTELQVLPPLDGPVFLSEAKARAAINEAERRAVAQQSREEARDKARQDAEAAAARLEEEAESARKSAESASDNGLWKEAFQQNQAELEALEIRIDGLDSGLASASGALRRGLPGIEEAALQLFSLATTHQDNPLMLESVDQRGMLLAAALRAQMQPLQRVQSAGADLRKAVDQIRRSLPQDAPEEQTSALSGIQGKLDRLEQRAAQALAPAAILLGNLDKMHTGITDFVPVLWQKRYLTPPSRFFDPVIWRKAGEHWEKTRQNLQLRMSVEMPRDADAWRGLGLRFCNVLLAGGIALFFLHRRMLRNASWSGLPGAARFRIVRGVLWCLSGLALSTAAFGSQGEQYRLVYTFGSLWLIWGEMLTAWGLRCLSLKGTTPFMPLWPLYAASAAGVALAYPEMPEATTAIGWVAVCLVMLRLMRRRNEATPVLENNLLHAFRISLWLGLVFAAVGWQQPGILLVVVTSCLCVSTQLVFGLLQHLNSSSEARENREVEHSVLAGILAACIAPLVLLLVVVAMFVWIVALPGGAVLLLHYMGAGVRVGSATFNMVHLFLILSAFYLTRAAVSAARAFLDRLSRRTSRLDKSLISPMQTAITYGLWTLFGLFTLQALGFGLDNLAVIAGGLSVGIGFGMQTIVNNFLSGLILIFSRTLHEGDVVDVGALQGTVRKISIRATTIETFDNAVIFVPNSEFVSNRLINWTRNGRTVRREVRVGVAYGTDPGKVEALLLRLAEAHPQVLRVPRPVVLFVDFGASTLDFTLRFWTDFSLAVGVASDIRREIARVFAQEQVEIAFPQLDVHMVPPERTEPARPDDAPSLPSA